MARGPTGKQYLALSLSEILEDDPPMILSVMAESVQQHINTNALVQSAFLASCEREDHMRQQGFADHLMEKSDYDFFRNLRVTKETFYFLLDIIKEQYVPNPHGGHRPLTPETLLLVTLWFLGNQESYREIAELFGISEGTVHKSVHKVITVLCSVGPRFIKWPSSDEVLQLEKKFQSMAGFPGVVGAVDGCHIKIKAPDEFQADFLDRTSTHSVNLMAVCDSEKRFTFVNIGFAGSGHDSRVFKLCPLYGRIVAHPKSVFPSNYYHLIGDSGFQLTPFLLVPYKDFGNLDVIKSRYNRKLSQTRYVIEHAFGWLKGRFRRLKYLDADTEKIPNIILACCIVHNIILGQANEEAFLRAEGYVFPPIEDEDLTQAIDLLAETGGNEKRDFVAALL